MKAQRKKNWTVMIYLAGNNNLAEECVWALLEMQKGLQGSQSANITVVAQLESPDGQARRYDLTNPSNGGKPGLIPRQVFEINETSNRQVLKNFLYWGIGEHPADHYMVVLSGHGSGTEGDFLKRDTAPPSALSIPDLRWVFNEVKDECSGEGKPLGKEGKIDILGLDSCLMSMAEIGYELRNHVKFMVGAEGFELNTGWPFEDILKWLIDNAKNNGEVAPKELAEEIVKQYIAYYKHYVIAGVSVDKAACDLSYCEASDDSGKDLKSAVNKLADALRKNFPNKKAEDESGKNLEDRIKIKNAVLLAHWEAQSYLSDQYADLYDFCSVLLEKLSELGASQPEIENACLEVKRIINQMAFSGYSGAAVQYSHGLSVYFPWSRVSEAYKGLEFAQDTKWDEFLLHYVNNTRRDARNGREGVKREPAASHPPAVIKMDPPFNKMDPPFNKMDPPFNKLTNHAAGCMKNPPIEYSEWNPDAGRSKKISQGDELKQAAPKQKTKVAVAKR
jgi:hypothetical protein